MSKRKYDDISSPEATSNSSTARVLRLQRLQLDGLLDHSKKSLFRSLKVARGFERQKLGRRQKTAKTESNGPDTARLEAEVAALKSLDLASTAEIHLYKSLLKIKSMASAPAFPYHVQATVDNSKKPQETNSVNVQARLFKSGPVQAAMAEALKGIRAVLGIEELKPNSKKRLRAKDFANDSQADDMNGPTITKKERSSTSTSRAQNEDEWSGLSASESPGKEENEELQIDNEEDIDYNMYASRLAGSSDNESVEGDIEDQDNDRNDLDDISITDVENSSEITSDTPDDKHPRATNPPPNPKRAKTPSAPPNSTTFLPSLSLGGYWSGSDSASSDNDSAAANIEVRRNRMGQQARRALWEKKFGKNANHVKNQALDKDQGWDARRGARGVDERGKRGRGRGKGGGGRGGGEGRGGGRGGGRVAKSTGANSDPVVARKATPKPAAEGPLHPSWEAARKAKEQKKAVPFQGRKVVFD